MKYSSLLQVANSLYKLASEVAKKETAKKTTKTEKEQEQFFTVLNTAVYPRKDRKQLTIGLVIPEYIVITTYKLGEPVPVALTEFAYALHPVTGKKQPILLFRFGGFSPKDKYLEEEDFPQTPQGRLEYAKTVLESVPDYQKEKSNLEFFNLTRGVFPRIENANYRGYVGVFFK
jgi:hypothetical protein